MMRDYLEAGCPEIAQERLEQLAGHEHAKVRARVAENPGCQKNLLLKLLKDEDCEVRCAVAGHPGQFMEIFELLLKDENPTVRFALAEDAGCPEAILESLLYDSNPYVCDRANRTLKRLKIAGFGKQSNSTSGFPARGNQSPAQDSNLPNMPRKTYKRRALG